MIPGDKDLKFDENLFAEGFMILGPAKNMRKKPFLEK